MQMNPLNPFRRASVLASLAAAVLLAPAFAASASGKPAHLACDSLEHPLGIDSSQPMFSWQLQDAGFAARQTAYRIEVARNAEEQKKALAELQRLRSQVASQQGTSTPGEVTRQGLRSGEVQ
jgi:hypothetical protein